MSHQVSCTFLILCAVIGGPAYAWVKQWNEAPAVEDACLTYDARYSEAPLFRVTAKDKNEKVYFFSRKLACAQCASCPAGMIGYLVVGVVVCGRPEVKYFRFVYFGTTKG